MKLLYFFPHNFIQTRSGAHRRPWEFLTYFRERGFSVDLLTLDGFNTHWRPEDLAKLDGLARAHVCRWRYMPLDIARTGWRVVRHRLPALALGSVKRRMRRLMAENAYDAVVINYVFWAELAAIGSSRLKVIDLHDFITLNEFLRAGDKTFRLGGMFADEVRAIQLFDCALSVSREETAALAPFCPGTRFVDAPVSLAQAITEPCEPDHELFFVGSADNPFNLPALEWLLDHVLPLLPPSVRLAVAGDVCTLVRERPGLRLLGRLDDLAEAYRKTRVVVAPVFGGTGMKVKVIEGLANGRPVVTTEWGVAGMDRKSGNGCLVANDPESFAGGIRSLLTDEETYREVRNQGLEYFRGTYSRAALWKTLDRVFLGPEAAASGGGG